MTACCVSVEVPVVNFLLNFFAAFCQTEAPEQFSDKLTRLF